MYDEKMRLERRLTVLQSCQRKGITTCCWRRDDPAPVVEVAEVALESWSGVEVAEELGVEAGLDVSVCDVLMCRGWGELTLP